MATNMRVQDENEYEDLLAEWSDLESGLGVILGNPESTQQFAHRVLQYDRWMQGLLQRDPDVGVYLLFQLASNSPVGYSASHSLVCAVLCHLIASELVLPVRERDSLVRAALTMNVGMTQLQDELANQTDKLTPQQQDVIRVHPVRGAMILGRLGVQDEDWLDIVSEHHNDAHDRDDLASLPSGQRLSRILKVVDRYAAMISPRMSRAGRSATDSARTAMAASTDRADPVGQALVRAVGLCPPGTYVRLDNDDLAVVLRRSSKANQPYVAVVGNAAGEVFNAPRLHGTAQGYPRIKAALAASAVRIPLNHYVILRLNNQPAAA
jgi:hypothetical protein